MIIQIAIIFAFWGLGEIFVALTALPIPSAIVGMLLLTLSLKLGIVSLSHVEKVADTLVSNMGLLFVPAGIGIMDWLGLLGAQILPVMVALLASTIVVIAVTGHTHQCFRRTRNLDIFPVKKLLRR